MVALERISRLLKASLGSPNDVLPSAARQEPRLAAKPEESPPAAKPEESRSAAKPEIRDFKLTPPWHIRHARSLLAAAALLAIAAGGFVAYQALQPYLNPADRLIVERWKLERLRAAEAVAPAPPAASLPVASPVYEAPTIVPAVRSASTEPVRTAPRSPSAPLPVTHTRAAEGAAIARTPTQVRSTQTKQTPPAGCAAAVAALGLCAQAVQGEGK